MSLDDINNYSQQIQQALHLYISNSLPQLYDNEKYLHTKWGIYEKPIPYTIQIPYGERIDAKRVV